MRKRSLILAACSAGFIAVVICWLWQKRNDPFETFVGVAVPESLRVTTFQNNAGFFNPEPVCYLAFTADSGDLESVIRKGQFRICKDCDAFPVPSGPQGWRTANQIGTNGNFYRCSHAPKTKFMLPVGSNRGWHEYLWIDDTGTNAYFLLWGI